jgi:gliding motility-associated-like protein
MAMNNDGFNDTFHASTTYSDGIYKFQMIIFNQWGNVIHTLENINDAWDGTINGIDAADGVYFWVCNYAIFDLSGKVSFRKQQGSVTLIR